MEVVVDSYASTVNAERGGAVRVELCSNLTEGGTTPSLGLFSLIKERLSIPVFVMIRPRGGDFLYSDEEFEVMKKELDIFKQNDADGFVFGILNADGTVDVERNQILVDLCKPKPITFHRAFDVTNDGEKALEDIISIGFDRILTSGMASSALEGLPYLKQLVKKAGDRIIIMPGGGINEKNIERILEGCDAKEFHGSARSSIPSQMKYQSPGIPMGAPVYPPEYVFKTSNVNKIKTMIEISKQV